MRAWLWCTSELWKSIFKLSEICTFFQIMSWHLTNSLILYLFPNYEQFIGIWLNRSVILIFSTASSGLNSIAAVCLEDILKKIKPDVSDQFSTVFSKVIGEYYLIHSVFPTLDWGWEIFFGISRGRGGMKNFQRQGRNFLGGESNFSGSGRGELKIVTQK